MGVHHGWLLPLRRAAKTASAALLALVFPPRCVLCDAELDVPPGGLPLCSFCRNELRRSPGALCPRCAAIVPTVEAETIERGCRRCQQRTFAFDGALALGPYEGRLRDAILRMKRPHEAPLSRVVGELLWECRAEAIRSFRAELVVPVPMYWRRRLRRGVNSPPILGRCLARSLGIPLRTGCLVRRRNTLPQADLSPMQRLRNVRGAFVAGRGKHVAEKRILLVDDILTTGATCSEAARALKRAGASAVFAVVVGRAQGESGG